MSKAKREEIQGLLDRGTFSVILREDVPPDRDARYVIGGNRDRMKDLIVHNVATLQPQSIRLLLAIAIIHGFEIWTADVRQAYLQSAEPLSRDILTTKPAP
eukprot:IDg16392t1